MSTAQINPSGAPELPTVVSGIIAGKPCSAKSKHGIDVVNPATEANLLTLAECSKADVDEAVSSARTTFDSGVWSRAPVAHRQEVLKRAASLISARSDELGRLDSMTTGLIHHAATKPQAAAAAGWFDFFASLIGSEQESLFRQLPATLTTVTREPIGVVGLFTPWNIPLMGASLKLAAALAAGNSCVLKPSEQSPLGAHALVEILHEAGLPAGALHLVNGRGAVTGAALASNQDVDAISFTGGENAGRIIAKEAANRFAKVTMELGGKSANIIFDDADYERALDGSIMAIYSNNGQACLAGSRIFVHRNIADRFIADFVSRANSIRVGDPFDRETEIGPQSSKAHMERVLSFIDVAREDGGEVLTGDSAARPEGPGYYVSPIVTVSPDNRARVCQEEIFGPFATFQIFDDEQDVVTRANDTRFGLAAYVWSEDLRRAHRVSQALRSGYVLINSSMARERNAPFGGFGHSGIDREGGRWSLDFYSEAKTTVLPFGNQPTPTLGK